MSGYTIQATWELPFEDTVAAVRAELGKAGFGGITEIDLRSALCPAARETEPAKRRRRSSGPAA